jgi:tripeptidyl-peptidase-1
VDLYNINYRVPGDSSPVDFAIAGFLDENPNRTQLHEFLAGYSPFRNGNYSSEYNFAVESINGGNDTDNGNGVEAQLDIQYSTPFIQPMNVTYFSTGGRGPYLDENGELRDPSMSNNEPWIEFLEALLRREKIPDVISISYTDNEETIPEAYARRTCDLFMQVGARGSSVLVATGDGGAAGVNFDPCLGEKFRPTFPVDCPYVTGVGATSYYAPAGAASYSSGGFSEYFDRPSWQDSDVTGYIKRINGSHDGWYTPKGRASPDISATGSRFLMKEGWTQKGTSASCPVIASMVALANDKRVRAGKPTLGYLNPLLYSEKLRPAYYDVTVGQTGSCTYTEGRVEFGWEATEGWDAATGLGTIDFSKFIEIVG